MMSNSKNQSGGEGGGGSSLGKWSEKPLDKVTFEQRNHHDNPTREVWWSWDLPGSNWPPDFGAVRCFLFLRLTFLLCKMGIRMGPLTSWVGFEA